MLWLLERVVKGSGSEPEGWQGVVQVPRRQYSVDPIWFVDSWCSGSIGGYFCRKHPLAFYQPRRVFEVSVDTVISCWPKYDSVNPR